MHLDDETIQRLQHRELSAALARSAEDHLASCAECRSRLEHSTREERWIFEKLQRLDHPPPPASARSMLADSRKKPEGWVRIAASVVLALAVTGIAYGAPGSPLPRLVDRLIALVAPAPAPPAGSSSGLPRPAQAGIAVDPGGHLTIAFESDQELDTAVVSLFDGNEVVIEATGGTTTFNSGPMRLLIQHSGEPARFRISIPREAPSVDLVVGGRSLLVKRDARLTGDVGPDSLGRYILPLFRSARQGS